MTAPLVPHETAAVLRMHRAGMSPPRIMQLLGMGHTQLIHELELAIDEEAEAGRKGAAIHDSKILATFDTVEKPAREVSVGDALLGLTFVAAVVELPAEHDVIGRTTAQARVEVELIDGSKAYFQPYTKVKVVPKED